jgi:hypothetical protein
MRKSLNLLAILATGLVAVAARAETYDGVHQGAGLLIRSEIAVQAVATAHAPDQNVASGSRGADSFASAVSSQTVYEDAVRAAHAPDQNVGGGSRVNSVVVSTMRAKNPTTIVLPSKL